jgi:hypothetical protein
MSQGNPTIDIYNEFAPFSTETKDAGYRGYYRMQGYDNYEKSFKNRLSGYYSLDVKDDEDLKILMHYFNDHLDGSEHVEQQFFTQMPTLCTQERSHLITIQIYAFLTIKLKFFRTSRDVQHIA